jgi:hypothetical protein
MAILSQNSKHYSLLRSHGCFWVNEGQPRVFKAQPVALGSQPRFGQSQQGMTVGEVEVEKCQPNLDQIPNI